MGISRSADAATRGGDATSAAPYHHGDLREALVAEAFARVRTVGAEAVSLRAVAQAVGVSPSAAYHHFPDKDAILVEVAERGFAELDRRAVEAAGALPVDDAAGGMARLAAVGAAYIGFAVEEPHLFRHSFGPYCAPAAENIRRAGGGEAAVVEVLHGKEAESSAYGLLVDTLDRLDALGALRRRDGVDLVAWAAVHGFAALALDGFLPVEAAGLLVDVIGSLVVAPPP